MTTIVVSQAKRHMCRKEEDMSSYGEGQVHQLMEKFEKEGFTSGHLTLLGQYRDLGSILDVLEGRAEIKQIEHLVDMQSDPFTPNVWTAVKHRQAGGFKWDLSKVELYLDEAQKNGGHIEGSKLRKKLITKDVSNANLLDFLLKNPQLIPESWKGQSVFFWGTIYRDADGGLYVRYLCWRGGRWLWRCLRLARGWDGNDPALVLGK